MVRNVVEVGPHLSADAGKVSAHELAHQFGHSAKGALKAPQLASQAEDASNVLSPKEVVERPPLHRKYVILDHFEDGQILIHDPVKDRVEDVIDALSELGGRTLELLSKVAQCPGVAVANGDKMVMASKDRRLAVTYAVPDQLSCLGDDVKLAVINFELGRAYRVHRVVDR